jgi:hypothetical protein
MVTKGGMMRAPESTGSAMSTMAPLFILAATVASGPSSEEILARVADTSVKRQTISYSGVRKYNLRNTRFALEATVIVQEVHLSGEPKRFIVLNRSGSAKLIGIVEKLLASEIEASRPEKRSEIGINATNYEARFRGTGTIAGRACYVIGLSAKRKNKYLINGTLWVDANNYGMVRLEGSTATRISMWLGTAHIVEEFNEVGGYWLPSWSSSVSSGMVLGTNELEIRYSGYLLLDTPKVAAEAPGWSRATGSPR